jgi:hypothetical protein
LILFWIRTDSINIRKEIKMEFLSSTLGTAFYTVVVFIAGALLGTPLWNWVTKKLPWNK